jgi:signal transduction histidine kinase
MAISDLGRTPLLIGSAAPAAVRRELAATAPAPHTDLEHETPQAAFERLKRRLIRLGFDIHDGPLQSLAAAGFGLKDLEQRLPDGEAARILGDIIAELADAERSLRSLAGTLEDGRPEIPLARDILAGELKRFARRSAAQVDVHGNWLYHPDSRSQALTIKALLRESLTNVAKHAGAREVVVRLQASATHVLLEIEDDGRGFEPGLARGSAGAATIGLASMHERVRLLGGDLEILSRAGGPTVVTAAIVRYRQPSRAESYTAPPLGGVA